MNLKRVLLVSWFLVSFLIDLIGQEIPKVIAYNRSEYNAGYQNWMITQDCQGYIVVANTEGILYFNGFTWGKVTIPRNQRPRAVYQGPDCKIYVAGFEFFGFIDFTDRSSPQYIPVADSIVKGSGQEYWSIYGNEEELYFQSFAEIYRYDFKNVTKLYTPSNIMLGTYTSERALVPKVEGGLYEIIRDTLRLVPGSDKLPATSKITAIVKGSNKEEWIIATQIDGCFLFDGKDFIPLIGPFIEKLKKEQINKLVLLESGEYVIGTILNGAYITEDFQNVKIHLNKSNGLSNNTVLSLFQDKKGSLWVGMDKGIDEVMINEDFLYFYDKQGMLGNVFTSKKYNDALYLGTNQGLFKKNENGQITLVENSQGQVWSLLNFKGGLLVGHNAGTYFLKNDYLHQISDVTGGWHMVPLTDNKILQSTYTGLVIQEYDQGIWKEPYRIQDGNILIESFILEDQRLVGYHSNYGICIVNFESDFQAVKDVKYIDGIEGIAFNNTLSLLPYKDGSVILFNGAYYSVNNDSISLLDHKVMGELNEDPGFRLVSNYHEFVDHISRSDQVANIRFNKPSLNDEYYLVGIDQGYVYNDNKLSMGGDSIKAILDYIEINGAFSGVKDYFELNANQHDLTIHFKKNIISGQEVNGKYKLQGWNSNWYNIPENGVIEFVNLDDGDFELLIDDVWGIRSIINFKVKPYWYESYIGLLIYLGMIGLILWWLNIRNKKKLKQQHKKLQKEKEKELESERIKAKSEKLERELLFKSKMLANSTMALVQKNNMLNELKSLISKETRNNPDALPSKQKVFKLINKNLNHDEDWEIFERNFAEVHHDFLDKLKDRYPDITSGELRLAAYIRMNLSSKEIAPLLNISVRSVENKRYRLRKKLDITHDSNLKETLLSL